jgi:hypothetical protein
MSFRSCSRDVRGGEGVLKIGLFTDRAQCGEGAICIVTIAFTMSMNWRASFIVKESDCGRSGLFGGVVMSAGDTFGSSLLRPLSDSKGWIK